MDGAATKRKDASTAYCCFTSSGRWVASLRAAAGNSRAPQTWKAAIANSGEFPLATEELWQWSLSSEREGAQTCEGQKGAQIGAMRIASKVKSAVIRRLFMVVLNATLRLPQSQIVCATRLLAHARSWMHLIFRKHDFSAHRAIGIDEISSGEQNAKGPPHETNS